VSASGQISRRSDRRFWSAALGLVLLGKRLYQRSGEDESIKGGRLPKGGIGKQASTKARAAWLEIARLLYAAIGQHRVVSIAAGVTFFVLLAIFPATGALVSVYGLFADPTTIQAHLNDMSSFLPGGAIEIIGDQLFDALNIVYGANESRGLVKLNAVSLGFTVGAVLVLILALGAIVLLPVALQYVGLSGVGDWILQLLRWPALYFVVVLALAFIYRFGPDRERAQWHWITWGSAIAALLWIIASILFSWYAANFGSYNKTYGSLGAAIGFMTWIWISSMVILGGAEIDAVMERLDRGTAK